jgi:tetratricopeptide (TPR) repeat protein
VQVFVGDQRRNLVTRLHELFTDVRDGGGPRLVLLSAPSGSGKTRVVQELYAALAAEQPEPPYWPDRLEHGDLDWRRARKLIYPHVLDVAPETTIPWMWWGLSCAERADGGRAQVIFDDATQLAAHLEALTRPTDALETLDRGVDATNSIIGLVGLTLGLTVAPVVGVALAAAGVSQTVLRNRDLVARLEDWVDRRRSRLAARSVDAESAGRSDQIDEIVASVVRASRRLPFVIVADDLHWADSGLLALLAGVLASPRARVLLLATAWPAGQAETSLVPTWLEQLHRERPQAAERVVVERLPPIDEEALLTLVDAEHAAHSERRDPADPEVATRLLERYGASPLGIRSVFALKRVRRQLAQRPLRIDDLPDLPSSLEEILTDYLEELPERLRVLIARLALVGQRVPLRAVLDDRPDTVDDLERIVEDFGLLRRIGPDVVAFVDHALHAVARRVATELLTEEDERALGAAVAATARRLDARTDPDLLCETTWAAHVGLAMAGHAEVEDAAGSSADIARLLARRHALREAIAAVDVGIALLGEATELEPDRCVLRILRARWRLTIGDADGAMRDLDQVLARHEVVAALDDGTLAPAGALRPLLEVLRARACAEVGGLAAATVEVDRLVGTLTELLGADSIHVLATRNLQATLLFRLGRAEDAITGFETLLRDKERVFDATSPSTLATRTLLARCYGEVGRTDDAVRLFRRLVQDKEQALGRDAPEVLNDRANLARWSGELGAFDEAREVADRLVADSVRLLGPEHPQTLARANLRSHLDELAGAHGRAADGYRRVLADKIRVLGLRHPHTSITRTDLARTLVGAGDEPAALELLSELERDAAETMDADDPRRLTIAAMHALTALRCGGEAAVPLARLATLREQAQATLGARSVTTLWLRNHELQALGAAGRVREAIERAEALVTELEQHLGARHRHTLAVRSNLARWLAVIDPDRAADEFAALAGVLEQEVGPEHPATRLVQASARQLDDARRRG